MNGAPVADHVESSSQEHEIRVEKVAKMREAGIEPWPEVKHATASCQQVIDDFVENAEPVQVYAVVGRVVSIRLHGKAAFVHLQEQGNKLQVYFQQERIGAVAFEQLQSFVDIGDFLWVKGFSFKTQRGEITLKADVYAIQSKCLHPLPEKFHGLVNVETRYRQRYLDLISNPESRSVLQKRSLIVQACREFLTSHGYLEVETPMLHPIAGGAAAKPFSTHHNALGQEFFLRIAPELYLKRLVVGGFDKVFELNRNFRNEGVSPRHNPEFTMLECYTAHEGFEYGMDIVEQLIQAMAAKVSDTGIVAFGEHVIDLSKPFAKISMKSAVQTRHNLSDADMNESTIDALLKKHHVALPKSNMTINEKIYLLFEETVESTLIQPTFIIDFPIEVSPLAKRHAQDATLAARAELFIVGIEFANLFNELNDPFDQADRFKSQMDAHKAGDEEAHQYDADFILALEHALPPTVGFGIGIDRLIMLITGSTSIKDVILFPTLKKK
ncbi:lysine--tRNA ligase [Candidatus Chromulinivorax destructor]|uniref:Lysine--tRNA ligase n=2 Tax=Candidatus Chromulinivorax destructor TaxID=2066483 RepID=A0A345ZD40_9BACT|nr:lysine--tRNA ligase [Candidatus Chromulinivorax destructor]